jgi:hypothetical protein
MRYSKGKRRWSVRRREWSSRLPDLRGRITCLKSSTQLHFMILHSRWVQEEARFHSLPLKQQHWLDNWLQGIAQEERCQWRELMKLILRHHHHWGSKQWRPRKIQPAANYPSEDPSWLMNTWHPLLTLENQLCKKSPPLIRLLKCPLLLGEQHSLPFRGPLASRMESAKIAR